MTKPDAIPPRRIVFIGLSGAGKSTVARLVAGALGWRWSDTDDEIVLRNGMEIASIFREKGEEYFRSQERQVITDLTRSECLTIATGGGAAVLAENRRRLWHGSLVVWLQAHPSTLVERLAGSGESRPLLQGDQPLERLKSLEQEREPLYALADCAVRTDGRSAEEVASEVVRLWSKRGTDLVSSSSRLDAIEKSAVGGADASVAAVVRTPSGDYPVLVGWDILAGLGTHLRSVGLSGRVSVVSDKNVASLYGPTVLAALAESGYQADCYTLEPGEQNKTLAATEGVFNWLVARHAERAEVIIALGGGVVTDLAGFVAATYLRGVPLVHVPTSLLGSVDAAIGGKTAVDHPLGKNLIGAFYQPRLVLIDGAVLRSLPRRELISGWAEVIKHGLIMDAGFVEYLESNAVAVRSLQPEALLPVLRRSVQLKAEVVSVDERESGLRSTLNYGHTIGHALEAATEYGGPLHGEAVAVGMAGAGAIANQLGLLAADVLKRQNALIAAYELPLSWPGADTEAVLAATFLDKKVRDSAIRWVLLTQIGSTIMRSGVPTQMVREVIAGLVSEDKTTEQRST